MKNYTYLILGLLITINAFGEPKFKYDERTDPEAEKKKQQAPPPPPSYYSKSKASTNNLEEKPKTNQAPNPGNSLSGTNSNQIQATTGDSTQSSLQSGNNVSPEAQLQNQLEKAQELLKNYKPDGVQAPKEEPKPETLPMRY